MHIFCLGGSEVLTNSNFYCAQNEERRTRTVVFVLIVTEELPEWDDSKNIGMF